MWRGCRTKARLGEGPGPSSTRKSGSLETEAEGPQRRGQAGPQGQAAKRVGPDWVASGMQGAWKDGQDGGSVNGWERQGLNGGLGLGNMEVAGQWVGGQGAMESPLLSAGSCMGEEARGLPRRRGTAGTACGQSSQGGELELGGDRAWALRAHGSNPGSSLKDGWRGLRLPGNREGAGQVRHPHVHPNTGDRGPPGPLATTAHNHPAPGSSCFGSHSCPSTTQVLLLHQERQGFRGLLTDQ